MGPVIGLGATCILKNRKQTLTSLDIGEPIVKRRIFISNCEGAISKNDNPFDLITHFVPEGDRIYDIITKYGNIRANFLKDNKKTAEASKLILPFLLAFDANNKNMEEFSAAKLVLLKNSKETLSYLKNVSEPFIVSTSYEHHMRAICKEFNFPLENTYSTKVNIDKFELTTKEKSKVKSLAWEIGGMPSIKIPPNARSLRDLSKNDQATISRLDKIFWNEIGRSDFKRIYSDVKIVGEAEKGNFVQNLGISLSSSLENVMYVGSDITDVAAMKLVQANGGLAVSFNGNEATVRSADIAVLSDDYSPVSIFADLFLRFGKAEAARIAGNFDKDALWLTSVDPELLDRLFTLYPALWPKTYTVSEWNIEDVVNQIGHFGKKIQG